ncbi:hypothetical protein HOLleu_20464 [Holothuria leucospilota]|uniref:Endonuclease/exonuclease/phosphatase domain-containing protein n=1 Tax=Holothuria leucospilota TaxID=206669 RepID=A0A9Q1C0Q9_HOLLE|nr:hypothetical protein HOLleu_20464 [Holothuria leucospilota]
MFFSEFSVLLGSIAIFRGELLILGDFNFHVDIPNDREASCFMDLLDSAGFQQDVHVATHRAGHTLDLVISRHSSHTLKDITVFTGSPSDHHIVKCDVNISSPLPVKTTIHSHKLCDIRVENFVRDIQASTLFNSPVVDLSHSIEQYENVLCDLIDKHAPVKERSVVLRPSSPWYCDELRKAKWMKRRSERKWLKSGLEIDKQIYCDQSKAYHCMIEQAKCNYHRNEIAKCDEKQLFKLVDRISNPASSPKLPDHDCKKSLANDFSCFFHNKIQMLLIRLTIISLPTVSIDLPEILKVAHVTPILKKSKLD